MREKGETFGVARDSENQIQNENQPKEARDHQSSFHFILKRLKRNPRTLPHERKSIIGKRDLESSIKLTTTQGNPKMMKLEV